jgi:hypothetical protein
MMNASPEFRSYRPSSTRVRAGSGVALVAVIGMLAACASSGGSQAEPALVFSGTDVPRCAFEPVGEVTAQVRMRGDQAAVEARLHPMLARAATRRGADAIMAIRLEGRFTVVATGTRPTGAAVTSVPWTGRAQAIRFVNPECRG